MKQSGQSTSSGRDNSADNNSQSSGSIILSLCDNLEENQNCEMVTEDKIGTRIECGGAYGIIKYIGPVEGYKGLWFGVDWDDPERGKHNGNVNGKQYFTARFRKSGSFVRREKVNFGQTLLESIKSRYGYKEDEQTAKQIEQQLLKFQKDINAPFLQLVGFDKIVNKQANFHSLKVINIRNENVSSIGAPLELQSLCPNIREIDISKNLFSSWTDVFNICSQLNHLYWINTSQNILTLPENYKDYYLPNISVLICGYMALTWDDINKLATVFQNVTELRVPFNSITDLFTPEDHNFKKLCYLDLEGNDIKYWSEIIKLSVIDMLEHLTLENVNLESIRFDASTTFSTDKLQNLTTLNINNNFISEWCSIAELNRLNKLECLRLTRNPILEKENFATRTQIIIAKIKTLKNLNGILIEEVERRGAEYDYIKKYGLEWYKVQNTPERDYFLIEHNRYLELIEKYGLPDEAELTLKPNNVQSSLIDLFIEYNGKKIQKKIPATLPLQKVVLLIQKLFKLESRPTLRRMSGQQPDIIVDLEDEMKELGYYSVQNGDIILVET